MAFKMKNPIDQIANTKSHGTNANYMKSGINMNNVQNMNNMKDSPVEWAWLGKVATTAAKGVGKAAKVVGKTIGKGAKAVGKAIKGGGGKNVTKNVVKEGAKKGLTESTKNVVKEGIKKGAKGVNLGADKLGQNLSSKATDALKKGKDTMSKVKEAGNKAKQAGDTAKKQTFGQQVRDEAIGAARDAVTQAAVNSLNKEEKDPVNPTAGFNVRFGNN
jgi:hypothetical protein